jgi:hypothetical protein
LEILISLKWIFLNYFFAATFLQFFNLKKTKIAALGEQLRVVGVEGEAVGEGDRGGHALIDAQIVFLNFFWIMGPFLIGAIFNLK